MVEGPRQDWATSDPWRRGMRRQLLGDPLTGTGPLAVPLDPWSGRRCPEATRELAAGETLTADYTWDVGYADGTALFGPSGDPAIVRARVVPQRTAAQAKAGEDAPAPVAAEAPVHVASVRSRRAMSPSRAIEALFANPGGSRLAGPGARVHVAPGRSAAARRPLAGGRPAGGHRLLPREPVGGDGCAERHDAIARCAAAGVGARAHGDPLLREPGAAPGAPAASIPRRPRDPHPDDRHQPGQGRTRLVLVARQRVHAPAGHLDRAPAPSRWACAGRASWASSSVGRCGAT